jgi:hypothetical protein
MSPEQRAACAELIRRKELRKAILDTCTPMQRTVLTDKSRYKAVLAGRRSGKTMLDARAIALSLEASGRDDWTFYSAVTRVVAKDLIWSKLEELNETFRLGWSMRSHESVIETPRGGMFRTLGYDDQGQVEKSAGYRIRLFVCDEPHSYSTRLKYLAEQKIGPALADLGGTLMLTGTPGVNRSGYWFEASTGKIPEFKTWTWNVKANPKFMRDAEEWIAEELRLKKWTVETPAFRREVLAEWCQDESAQVYQYVADRNSVTSLEINPAGLFTLGCDFGVVDHSAWCVLYTPPHSRMTYVIHAESRGGLLPDEATEVTRALVERYRPSKIVGDAGGLGKPYVEQFNRRYGNRAGFYMHAAEKTEKLANIAIVNGELRAGNIKLLLPEAAPMADEIVDLVWADERCDKEHPACNNHMADAGFAYGYRAHIGYLNDVKAPPPADALERERQAAQAAQWERIQRVQSQLRASRNYDEEEY